MQPTNKIITAKFLTVCPPTEAVQWLKDRREKIVDVNHECFNDHEFVESALLHREDPYIDFGLARYGLDHKVAHQLYARGDEGLRCTILANVPNGGVSLIGQQFAVAEPNPDNLVELAAFMSNPNLDDRVFESCFERKGLFSLVSDENYRSILFVVGENPRISRPYDERRLDGWADYSYHKVFSAAWTLTTSVPANEHWAASLWYLLRNCLPPINFDPIKALSRWYIETSSDPTDRSPVIRYAFHLRSRLADLLTADDALLKASDLALRASFYRRFDPSRHPGWPKFAEHDGEEFLNEALANKLVWRSETDRDLLGKLCWDHPDPNSHMDMPNFFNATEERMRNEHPDWFLDSRERLPTTREVVEKITQLEERIAEIASSNKSFWRK